VNDVPVSSEFLLGLREAEETYRELVEGVPAILYVDAIDDLSSNLYTSPQIERILGFTGDQWREDPGFWMARLHEGDRERVMGENRRTNETGEPFHAEYRIIAADNREVWVRDEAVLVRSDAGEPMFWRGMMLDITEQKLAEEKLQRSVEMLRRTMAERRQLLSRLEEAQEEERKRIASDIHDDSIQVIGAADLRVQVLQREITDPTQGEALADIHDTMQLAIERLRHLLFELRPPALDREGLVATLRLYLDQADPDERLEYELDDRLDGEPPSETRAVLFRLAQEAVTNARKHSNATTLRLLLSSEDGGVRLRIADDGRGFDPREIAAPVPGHLGVPTMIERAELAGGWCRVDSKPGEGTTVESWIPLEPSRAVGARSG
jgi:PAS domain S-box-containing protein